MTNFRRSFRRTRYYYYNMAGTRSNTISGYYNKHGILFILYLYVIYYYNNIMLKCVKRVVTACLKMLRQPFRACTLNSDSPMDIKIYIKHNIYIFRIERLIKILFYYIILCVCNINI